MSKQLELFPKTVCVSGIIGLLNDGRKKPYKLHSSIQFKDKEIIILCVECEGNRLYNIVDFNGKTPNGFSANWRIARDVFNDAGILAL